MPRHRRRVARLRTARSRRSSILPAVLLVLALMVAGVVESALQTPAGAAALGIGSLAVLAAGIYIWVRIRRGREIRRRSLAELLALAPSDFEVAVATLLKDLGYRSVKHIGGSGDLAADIFCRDQQGRSVVVQCKRYGTEHPVSSPEVQQFIGMQSVHHRADRGIYVTTSTFTGPAAALARKHDLELIDGKKLTELVVKQHQSQRPLQTSPEVS